MSEKIIRELYNGEVTIEFYPESHRYRLVGDKKYLISTTGATGIIDKSRVLIPWAVNLATQHMRAYLEAATVNKFTTEELLPLLEEAAKQHQIKKDAAATAGSAVHKWAENFAQAKITGNNLPDIPEDENEQVINGIMAFLDWYNGNKVKFLETERLIYSRQYGFVGILDVVAEVNGAKMLCDYKTAKGIYTEMHYQLAGYRGAYDEEMDYTKGDKLQGAMILHFNKETGEFSTKIFDYEDHVKNYETFLACLRVKQREKELATY